MTALPAGWTCEPLASLGDWYGGGTPSKSRPDYWEKGTVPWLSPKDMRHEAVNATQDYITATAVTESSTRLVPSGSVAVVVRSGILERKLPVAVVPIQVTLNQDMKALVPREGIDARWVAWGLRARERDVLDRCRKAGTTVASLDTKRLLAEALPLPPLEEQRRLIELLEDHLSRLAVADATMTLTSRRLGRLRLSSLSAWRRKLQSGGRSPQARLGDVADTSLGKMLDAKKAQGELSPYLRNINVRWGSFDLSDVFSVQLTKAEQAKFAVRKGDLLVCEGGEPGRCAIWDGPTGMSFQKALHRVRVRDEEAVSTAYIALMVEEFVRSGRADRMFTGTTIKHLPQEKLREITFPLPAPDRQRQIVQEVGELATRSGRIGVQIARSTARSSVLRTSLLESAFLGHLSTSAPSPAREAFRA